MVRGWGNEGWGECGQVGQDFGRKTFALACRPRPGECNKATKDKLSNWSSRRNWLAITRNFPTKRWYVRATPRHFPFSAICIVNKGSTSQSVWQAVRFRFSNFGWSIPVTRETVEFFISQKCKSRVFCCNNEVFSTWAFHVVRCTSTPGTTPK